MKPFMTPFAWAVSLPYESTRLLAEDPTAEFPPSTGAVITPVYHTNHLRAEYERGKREGMKKAAEIARLHCTCEVKILPKGEELHNPCGKTAASEIEAAATKGSGGTQIECGCEGCCEATMKAIRRAIKAMNNAAEMTSGRDIHGDCQCSCFWCDLGIELRNAVEGLGGEFWADVKLVAASEAEGGTE